MLCRLDISNYALIENLNLDFSSGYSVITGETGAGKSILLKALNLLLGERADSTVIKQNDKKCVLEAEFKVKNIISKAFFNELDIDYEPQTIIRREFTASGKSRLFINDTPVTLNTLKTFGEKLMKIHTQHQTLDLFSKQFQMELLDSFSNTEKNVANYTKLFSIYKSDKQKLINLKLTDTENRKEKDYIEFLLTELDDANLDTVNISELENEHNKIQNWSAIKEALDSSISIFQNSENSPIASIDSLLTILHPLQEIDTFYNELILRLNSAKIELQDIEADIESKNDLDDLDEEKAILVKEKIESINALSYKHNVNSISELIELRNKLAVQITGFGSVEEEISELENSISENYNTLVAQAGEINAKREAHIVPLQESITTILQQLAMPNAEIKIDLALVEELNSNGLNTIDFLFKTNLGGDFLQIKKSASGGELSRLMLAILVILAKTKSLPTLIFDEIDTGVSGEVAAKMAAVFEKLGKKSQLISITHLPQIAGKGKVHYHVFKSDSDDKTRTKVVKLSDDERVVELAKMMSGEKITDSAIENAKQLLNS
jgi:DNA repair protein RecN (Recombination protein N)